MFKSKQNVYFLLGILCIACSAFCIGSVSQAYEIEHQQVVDQVNYIEARKFQLVDENFNFSPDIKSSQLYSSIIQCSKTAVSLSNHQSVAERNFFLMCAFENADILDVDARVQGIQNPMNRNHLNKARIVS